MSDPSGNVEVRQTGIGTRVYPTDGYNEIVSGGAAVGYSGLPGDYYTQTGKYIGSDGKDDYKNYVVTNKEDIRTIRRNDRGGGTTPLEDVESAVGLPSAYVRSEMEKAVERAGSPSFHEEGGFFGMDNCGNEYVVHAKPGEEADPSLKEDAAINVFQAADPSSIPGGSIVGTFHTHPDGTKTIGNTTHFFLNEPSGSKGYGDIPNARTNSMGGLGNHYVLAQGNKTVYIYNGTGTLGTLPFRSFFSIGIK